MEDQGVKVAGCRGRGHTGAWPASERMRVNLAVSLCF